MDGEGLPGGGGWGSFLSLGGGDGRGGASGGRRVGVFPFFRGRGRTGRGSGGEGYSGLFFSEDFLPDFFAGGHGSRPVGRSVLLYTLGG